MEFIGGKQVVYKSMQPGLNLSGLCSFILVRMRESGVIIAVSAERHYETLNRYSGI